MSEDDRDRLVVAFAFYATSQADIFMIPATYDDRTPVTLSFAKTAVEYDTDNYEDFGALFFFAFIYSITFIFAFSYLV